VAARTGQPLSELATVMRRLPQVLVNVRVADRHALEGATAVWEAVEREQARLGDTGRVLVRPSGTEALVRVMVEAETQEEATATADRLAAVVATELG
jgi:phosphoglucosamine mutase